MKLRADGKIVTATLDKRYADTPVGHAVIVLSGDMVVEPSFAALRDYRIVEATAQERAQLCAAGYDLADWNAAESDG